MKRLRARLWLRVSPGKNQDEEQQLPPCLRRCTYGDKGEPWEVDERPAEKGGGIYRAHHIHGDDVDHPLRRRVFADAATGKYDVLVVWELSRFSRGGILSVLQDRESLHKCQVRLVSVREEWADNELLIAIAAWQDQQKLAQIRDGTKRKLDQLRELLKTVPGGTLISKKRGMPFSRLGRPTTFTDEMKAQALKMAGDGLSPGAIARELGVGRTTVWDFLAAESSS